MTTITDLAGYLASTMVLLTFMTKDMRLLRVLGILSNIAFISYGTLAWLPPVFCLHLLLLPINVLRLRGLLAEKGLPAAFPGRQMYYSLSKSWHSLSNSLPKLIRVSL